MNRNFWLAGAAALALAACGQGGGGSYDPASIEVGSPLDQAFSLDGGSLADIDGLIALLPEDGRPTYGSVSFDEKLGATVVTDLKFADEDDGEGVVFGRVELYGLDNDAIDRVQNAETADNNAAFETIFDKVRLLDMSVDTPDLGEMGTIEVTAAGIEFDTFKLRQGAFAEGGEGNEIARFFNNFELGGFYLKDLVFNADIDAAAADGSTYSQSLSFLAPDSRVIGIGGGKIEATIDKGFSYTIEQGPEARAVLAQAFGPQFAGLFEGPLGNLLAPTKQTVTIATSEWRGIDASGLLEYGLKGELPPITETDVIDLGSGKATGYEVFIGDKKLGSVGEMAVPEAKFTWLIPSKLTLDVKDAVADYTVYVDDPESEAYAILKEAGFDNIENSGAFVWDWNDKTGDAVFDMDSLSPGIFDMFLDFELVGANLEEIGALQETGDWGAYLTSAGLKSFTLKVVDDKLLDVMFDLGALQMGGTGADLRTSSPALIRLSAAQFAQLNPRIADYFEAAAGFVGESGEFEISIKPEEPILFMEMENLGVAPQDIPDVLNLTVTHEASE